MRIIDILNLIAKCYTRKRSNSPYVCYIDKNTGKLPVFVNGDCCSFIVRKLDAREDGIYLDIEEY